MKDTFICFLSFITSMGLSFVYLVNFPKIYSIHWLFGWIISTIIIVTASILNPFNQNNLDRYTHIFIFSYMSVVYPNLKYLDFIPNVKYHVFAIVVLLAFYISRLVVENFKTINHGN